MAKEERRWPPVDRYLVERLREWAGDEIPPFKDGMSPDACLAAMAERRGIGRIITKLQAVSNSQREEAISGANRT